MKSSDWAVIIVALISVVSAVLAGRSARKAAKYDSEASITNSRTVAETEAYNRARKMDIETIERQDKEIDEVREQNRKLRAKIRELQNDYETVHEENRVLRQRVTRLEQQQEETCE
jgi:peptidoglycan hydrolase CwlO-like protein